MAIVKRSGVDAVFEAAERAGQLLDEDDLAGTETWHRIAGERLQAKASAEKVH